jgi:hypothetical protein
MVEYINTRARAENFLLINEIGNFDDILNTLKKCMEERLGLHYLGLFEGLNHHSIDTIVAGTNKCSYPIKDTLTSSIIEKNLLRERETNNKIEVYGLMETNIISEVVFLDVEVLTEKSAIQRFNEKDKKLS